MKKLSNLTQAIIIINFFLIASTLMVWYITKSIVTRETTKLFNQGATIIEDWITDRFESYKNIAYGLQGFSTSNELTTNQEWQAYLKTFKIEERFPSITGVSYVKRINDNYITTHAYPSEKETIIGINMAAEEKQLQAINLATDNASITITDKIFLGPDQSPGFIMFTPVYQNQLPLNTPEERRIAIKGLIAITFKSEQVFKGLFDAHNTFPHFDFELYKGNVLGEDHILYDHDYSHYIPKTEAQNRLEAKRTIIANGEILTLLVSSTPSFGLKTIEKQLPNIILIAGLVLNALIFIFTITKSQRL